MIPRGGIVSGPGSSVALSAGEGGARVLHAVDVVHGAVVELDAAIQPVDNFWRHGLAGALEHGGLIHIIPKARDPHAHKTFVQPSPPGPRVAAREFREDAFSGPDHAGVDRPVGVLEEMVTCHPGIVRRVAEFLFYVEIGDGHNMKTLAGEVADHPLEVWEALAIDGEGAIAVLIVNVQVDEVCRNSSFAETPGDLV